ncbi:MAG: SDR family oxidoreductase [Armatimonadota bacterium]
MSNDLQRWSLGGRRVLVTGGTKGIGWAVAEEFLALGASVTIAARGDEEISQRVESDRTGRLFGIPADVATAQGRSTATDYAAAKMGGLDYLVNNAGTNIRKSSAEFSPEEFSFLFDTNLVSAWELSRLAYPFLKASATVSGDAGIVNIGSVAGSVAVGSGAPYAMTKAAMDQMTRYIAVEWGPDHIRTNAVLPWYTRTFRVSPYLDAPDFTENVLAKTPLGRVAESEDISGVVAFLCLPAARYVTGQTIAADGGFLAYGFGFEKDPKRID